jgi:hypothetical protein
VGNRVWVLDTETKGTGAEMVPLDKVLKKPAPRSEPLFVPPKRAPREPEPVAPRAPRRFRIVDVATRAVLADDVGAREALEALGDVRSSVDVHVFIRDDGDWQLLSLAEQRTMWERRRTA